MPIENKNRKTIRLKEYDYSLEGEYFVTICTHNRESIFGEVINGEMRLNEVGKIAEKCWMEIPNHFPNTELDIFQIMPNHVHLLISILCNKDDGGDCRGLINQTPTKERDDRWILMRDKRLVLGKIIRAFKAKVTFLAHKEGLSLEWQRNYYEEIIKDERHYGEIYDYIQSNPQTWDRDKNNPKNL